jgi:hypothetical protein
MKQVLILLSFLGLLTITTAQGIFKKKLDPHESAPGYFWFKPVVDVDTTTLSNSKQNLNTLFLVEGQLTDGTPIQIFVEGKTLKVLLQLPSKQNVQTNVVFSGYMFTVKSLGQYSVISKHSIKKSKKYYDKQRSRLLRERHTEKYELWSESPTKVQGHMVDQKIVPTTGGSGTMRYNPPQN